jgi:hypothetical protein
MTRTAALQHRRIVVARHIGHIERLIASTPAADRQQRERLLAEHLAEACALDAAIAGQVVAGGAEPAPDAIRGAGRMTCPRCKDVRLLTYDELSPDEQAHVGLGSVFPCPDCQDTGRPARPVRLQLSRRKGFDLQALSRATNGLPARNVARPSTWGNPYRIGVPRRHVDGRIVIPATALEAAAWYREYLEYHLQGDTMRPALDEDIAGRNIACWCDLDEPCHGDVLLELANG